MSPRSVSARDPAGIDRMVWSDVDLSDPQERDWLAQATDVDGRARRLLLEPGRVQRRVRIERGFVASLQGAPVLGGDESGAGGGIGVLITGDRVITTHVEPRMGIDAVRGRVAQPDGPHTPLAVLAELVIEYVDRVEDVVFDVCEATEETEDLVLVEGDDPPLSAVAGLRHKVFRLRRALVSQRSLLNVILADRSIVIHDDDRAALAAAIEHVACHLDTLEDARERLQLLHDRVESELSLRMNRSSYNLTVVATVFLPLTFVTGLLGMNVAGMPEAHDPEGFWVVCGALAVLAAASWWLMLWRRWV